MNCNRLHKSHLFCLKLVHLVISLLALTGLALAEAESYPPEASAQDAQDQLFFFAEKSIHKAGLAISHIKALPVIGAAEQPLHRGRFEFCVTGSPKAICGWLEVIHDLDRFHAIATLRISPSKRDLNHSEGPGGRLAHGWIPPKKDPNPGPGPSDCRVELNQWFVPKDAATASSELDVLWKRTVKKLSSRLSPVTVWEEIQKCVPGDSDLRIALAEISVELEMTDATPNHILILGGGKTPSAVKLFGENLKKSKSLDEYQWKIHPPQETKGGDWSFEISATNHCGSHA